MTNSFYNKTGVPATNAPGLSQDIRAEFAAIEAGFNKLPTLSGNAGKSLIVNAGGNAVVADPVLHLNQSDIARGTDIAVVASGSVTLPAIGSYFVVTGTGFNVTGFNDSYNGRIVSLKLSDGLTLVHSASLVLEVAFDRVTNAGDVITLVNESAGVWREISYKYINGTPRLLVYKSANSGVIAGGSAVSLGFNAKIFDSHNLYNTATFEATIKTPGVYSSTVSCRLLTNTGVITLTVTALINAVIHSVGQMPVNSGSNAGIASATRLLHLAVGDKVTFEVSFIGTSGVISGGASTQTFASLYKI